MKKLFGKKKEVIPTSVVTVDNTDISYFVLEINRKDSSVRLVPLHGEPVTFVTLLGSLQTVRDQVVYDLAISQVKDEKATKPENNQPIQ